MPPKRKAAAKKPAAGGKKAKKGAAEEPEAGTSDGRSELKKAISALKKADKGKKKTYKVDSGCPLSNSGEVFEDYDCMLNQTNIGHNNNKYYIIQVIKNGNNFYAWNRWGRVGESGANALKNHGSSKESAIKDFEKKFSDKTKNKWANKDSFEPKAGKYTMIEMNAGDDDDEEDIKQKMAKLDEVDGVKKVVAASELDKPTQDLMKLIFDNDMFKSAMADIGIDVKKMPLGKLSKLQIARGFEVLEELETAIETKKSRSILELSSRFYTVIPHDFGRVRPPLINDMEHLRKKYDMLMVLADIELAQAIQKDKKVDETLEEIPNPFDANYETLCTELETVDKKSKEFKIIEEYTNQTAGVWRKPKVTEVWKVNREDEGKRFKTHDSIKERKLLWHGTNVAVVAAILKSGLRIMPHSGGRVGKGIYFASENGKSAGYVRTAAQGVGIMFLAEVALGKEHHITVDDWRLTQAPKGFDSIVAKGHTEPDPKKDTTLPIEGKKIVVPQGKPVQQPSFSSSNFSQSEYLVYKESQARIRYMLKMKF